MQKEILINVESQEKRVAVVSGGKLEEYYIERPQDIAIVGNIYKGIVNSVVQGIGAAFVDIGYQKNGFLYVSDIVSPSLDFDVLEETVNDTSQKISSMVKSADITKLVHKGQEVLVQVVKESIGNKGPRLTTHIGIPGRFIVFMPFDHNIGISKRVTDRDERERLYKILKKIAPMKMGLIVRTVGVGKGEGDFKREVKYLTALWDKIRRSASKIKAPNVIHEEYGLTFRILRDIFNEHVARVLVDDREEYRRLRHFANSIMPAMKRNLMLYREKVPLFDSRGIEKEIEKLYRKKIELDCKGYIVIEETEGLIAIDVNSGSFTKRHMEDTAFKVNSEAAVEIARQIRLRDIGGIVIIDFIDMVQEKHRREIFNILVNSVRQDKAKINILRMSEFGIVEMTRQRVRKGVRRVSYINCPYCSGRGSVKSVATMAIEVLRILRKELEGIRVKEIRSLVHPEVANYLLNENRISISQIEDRYRTKIVIIADREMHIERFSVQK